jgi:hypothetical protein
MALAAGSPHAAPQEQKSAWLRRRALLVLRKRLHQAEDAAAAASNATHGSAP